MIYLVYIEIICQSALFISICVFIIDKTVNSLDADCYRFFYV